MMRYGKWIRFELKEKKPKTNVYVVIANDRDILLGEIRWYASWRKYTFMPEPNTVYETKCLSDIIEFIDYLMNERKKRKLGQPHDLTEEEFQNNEPGFVYLDNKTNKVICKGAI